MHQLNHSGKLVALKHDAAKDLRQAQEEARQAVRQAQREMEKARDEANKAGKDPSDHDK